MWGFMERKKDTVDLWGNPIIAGSRGKISDKFFFPPFTVFDSNRQWWQDRKRMWIGMGLESRIGREARAYKMGDWVTDTAGVKKTQDFKSGQSIFDPVLTELLIRWFCPPGGQILDPFAGGSVRGIVASTLGMQYWGVDLSSDQIEENIHQADEIIGLGDDFVPIVVSGPSLRQPFSPCTLDYINAHCHGYCCNNAKVYIHPSERHQFTGLKKTGDFLAPGDDEACVLHDPETGVCSAHFKKPFSCRFDPWTLNANGTLILRNMYRRFMCFKGVGAVPAYQAHRESLNHVLGKDEAKRVIERVESGEDRIESRIPNNLFRVISDNQATRTGNHIKAPTQKPRPQWILGDSVEEWKRAPRGNFLLMCPPYGNLEKYSDDPLDLSTMKHHEFLDAYRTVVVMWIQRMLPNSFMAVVVGDFRDEKGFYRNFVGETIQAFVNTGMGDVRLYNEGVLITSTGTAALRVEKQFDASRKWAKIHQNVLVFIKGDPKLAAEKIQKSPAPVAEKPTRRAAPKPAPDDTPKRTIKRSDLLVPVKPDGGLLW